jgi:integrase
LPPRVGRRDRHRHPSPDEVGQAYASGEDLGVVSRILGHANLATTVDVYAHLTSAMLDRAAGRREAILGG